MRLMSNVDGTRQDKREGRQAILGFGPASPTVLRIAIRLRSVLSYRIALGVSILVALGTTRDCEDVVAIDVGNNGICT
jgi:hypothetical protein